jgi:hypothetical protein
MITAKFEYGELRFYEKGADLYCGHFNDQEMVAWADVRMPGCTVYRSGAVHTYRTTAARVRLDRTTFFVEEK